MPYPNWAAGQRITAALLTAMQPQTARKTSTTTSSNNTYQADGELTLPLAAGATYSFRAFISYATLAAAGLNLRLSYSGTLSASSWTPGAISGSSSTTADTAGIRATRNGVGTGLALAGGNGASNFLVARPEGSLITVTAGNLFVEWSQNVTNATASQLEIGSWLRVERTA